MIETDTPAPVGLLPEWARDRGKLTRLFQKAVADALQGHKNAGNPVAGWVNGRAVTIPPEKIVVPEVDPPPD